MYICAKCKKEYDPADDFLEDSNAAYALSYFIDGNSYEHICGRCSEKLMERLSHAVLSFF
jgi:DNA-directed RNA polymerase subunit RPC12/RpoP